LLSEVLEESLTLGLDNHEVEVLLLPSQAFLVVTLAALSKT